MKAKVTLIRKTRKYSEEFKRELVKIFESGKFSILQLSKLYGVPFSLIYKWIYRYSPNNEKGVRIVEMKESSTSKLKSLEQKVKDLEQVVGQKQIQIEFLEKMIEIAEKELKIDIKKKSSTPQSAGSGKSGKN
jgi:transposase-like protein